MIPKLPIKIPERYQKYIPKYYRWKTPRYWSNKKLREVSYAVEGSVVNVSAWGDKDKEGKHYIDYFPNAASYDMTNYSEWKGGDGISLDLTKDLPKEFLMKWDVVFNHTTLEHIFDVHKAFENLCLMSKKYVFLVTPFKERVHDKEDYWRMTPQCIERLFNINGFKVMKSEISDYPLVPMSYIFTIALRDKK